MLRKRGMTEDVYGMALQRLSDTAKAALPEPQCPGVEPSHSSVARLYTDINSIQEVNFPSYYALTIERCLMKTFKDTKG